MSFNLPDDIPRARDGVAGVQPLRDGDTSTEPDRTLDAAQAEWDRTNGQSPEFAELGEDGQGDLAPED